MLVTSFNLKAKVQLFSANLLIYKLGGGGNLPQIIVFLLGSSLQHPNLISLVLYME